MAYLHVSSIHIVVLNERHMWYPSTARYACHPNKPAVIHRLILSPCSLGREIDLVGEGAIVSFLASASVWTSSAGLRSQI